ncbi:PIN domain-containing protein [Microbacterium sp. KRD172]|uniref:PIN domain-containing protein n=1 Tax=Microbacterium sp. KRD172 TaxID=2729727 RepID=UPI0019D280DC|nr:PIN domain-containing protein [Microbacterium sp. KRD172]
MSFPAFFDTNVLYGALINDFILELADRGLFRPLWSKDVMAELSRNMVANGEDPHLVEKRISTMERYFADAMVTGYDDLVSTMTNDEKDRHVVAAAVRGGAEVLVTFNLKDFPADSVEPFDPDWLFDRLAQGARANRREIEREYAPIAREKYRAELVRREREIDARLLTSECIDAIQHYGAAVTLHADIACEFTHQGKAWAVRRADTMLRWMSHGATAVQVRTELAARVARLVFGRSVAEVRTLLEV